MSQRPHSSECASDLHISLSSCYLVPTLDDKRDCLQSLTPVLSYRNRSLSPPTKDTINLPTLQDSLDYHISTSHIMTSRSTTLSPWTDTSLEQSDTEEDLRPICPESPVQPKETESDTIPSAVRSNSFRAINHDPDDLFDSIIARNRKRRREASPIDEEDDHGTDIDQMDSDQDEQITGHDSDQDVSQDLEDLLEEAHGFYGERRPEFCIGRPEEKTRPVKLDDSAHTVLVFCTWLGSDYGYWLLTINGDRHIVKHIRRGYHIWQGVDEKFARNPIAFAYKGGHHRAVNTGGCSLIAEASPIRNFRNRTLKQEKPYSIYNAQKKIEDKGDTATESQLELAVNRTPVAKQTPKRKVSMKTGSKKCKLSTPSVLSKSRRSESLSSNLTSLPVTPASASRHSISNEHIADNIVLRTRLDTVDGPSIAVFLKDIRTCVELFEKLEAKWTFRLSDSRIRYCIAHFDWLDNDKSILMQENDEDGFRLLIDEIRRAPGWKKGEQINVALELHAV